MMLEKAKWLLTAAEENSFWCFRRRIEIASGCEARLEIAADSNFAVFCNDKWIPAAQLMDVPPRRNVTELKIALRPGKNILAISLYYLGHDTLTYQAGTPGLAAIIYQGEEVLACTGDGEWRYKRDEAYLPCSDLVSLQLGFTYCYDATKAAAWLKSDFDDSSWAAPQISGETPDFRLREIPLLKNHDLQQIRISQAGYLLRNSTAGTPAVQCSNDLLVSGVPAKVLNEIDETGHKMTFRETLDPDSFRLRSKLSPWLEFSPAPDGTNGYYIIIDLLAETVGLLNFALEAAAGTVIDIIYGEHLDDGRVRSSIDGRNFCDRYICKEGRQTFTHYHRRYGAKYLELHITGISSPVRLGYIQLIKQELPLPSESFFLCDDRLMMRSRDVGIETLRLCMHEHYEDCVWREQALYGYDSRNQALYGYYIWGNYDFALANFRLLSRNFWQEDPAFMALTSPGRTWLTIPVFSFAWIIEVYELYLHSGNREAIASFEKPIQHILTEALKRQEPTSGLYYAGHKKGIWNFFEWSPGLCGGEYDGTSENPDGSDEPNALYNCYLFEALSAANELFGGYDQVLNELRPRIESYFWNQEAGYYDTFRGCKQHHLHTQALMLFNDLVPKEKRSQLALAPVDDSLVPLTFSSMPYFLRVWMKISSGGRRLVEQMVRTKFGTMVTKGATSFWETPGGGDAFSYAGSLCHGWSNLPVYYCHAVILGVTPLEPGFRKFLVKPYPGNLPRATGSIPTPHGDIEVFWTNGDNGLEISVCGPEDCQPVFEAYPEYPLASAKYNEVSQDFTVRQD